MNLFRNKRCPRCNEKMPVELVHCPSCGLNFQKFEDATNLEAKQALKEGEKDRVLLKKGCPKDVNKIKLLLITIFLGFTGAHYYFVGRNKTGLVFSAFFLVGLINAVLSTMLEIAPKGDLFEVFTLLVVGWGIVLCLWIIDIAKVCFNKFKIPVSRK